MLPTTADKKTARFSERFPGSEKGFGLKSYNELSDEELVKIFVQTKDESAFNELVSRYGDRIFRLALRITHDPNDAEEVLQEVFLTLVGKLDTFRQESKFSTWLYRVTTNASYMLIRSEKRKQENELDIEDYKPYNESGKLEGIQVKDWSDRPDEALLSWESKEIIERAVNDLPLPYRVVFQLRDVEGLTNEEVAKVLGLSLPAVKSRVLRARLFLRDKLSDYFYDFKK